MKFLKNTIPVLLLAALSLSTQAQVGNPAPNFTVTDTYGNTHTLYDYLDSGKVVVLDFFFTTCIPCQFYSPQVNLAYEKYGCNTANVFFISIDYHDTNAEVLAYDEEYDIEYPSVSGLNGGGDAVVSLYNVFAFPTFYLIDSSKTIVEKIDPPTLQVFDYRFEQLGILPAECIVSAAKETYTMERLELFPNPVTGSSLNVRLHGDVAVSGNFEIMDCRGSTVRSGQLDISGNQVVEVPLGNLPPGVFLLKINALKDGKMYRGRFVKE
jgi:thiol-disulfide isomerase/thioredoxin